MALLTAGTKLTTSLSALQFQPGGLSTADSASLMLLIKDPTVNGSPRVPSGVIENNRLYLPDNKTPAGIELRPGDWIMVDGAGYPLVIPSSVFSTSWQHS